VQLGWPPKRLTRIYRVARKLQDHDLSHQPVVLIQALRCPRAWLQRLVHRDLVGLVQ
jgi:hypothetical protein